MRRPRLALIALAVAGGSGALGVVVATIVFAAPVGAKLTSDVDVVFPPKVTTAAATTAVSVSGGAVIPFEGSRLDELTEVTVGGVSAKFEVTSEKTATVVVPASATFDAGTAPVEFWDGESEIESPPVQVEYQAQSPVDQQMAYAFDHWNNYNVAEFGDFNPWGGDCVNFVSQTLLARGWVQTDDWYNDAQQSWTPSFVHVPSMDDWLRSNPDLGATILTLDQRDQVKVGDIVVMDWDGSGSLDHTQVVSRVSTREDGTIKIEMVGHNLDTDYRDLDVAFTEDGRTQATAYFWSIP